MEEIDLNPLRDPDPVIGRLYTTWQFIVGVAFAGFVVLLMVGQRFPRLDRARGPWRFLLGVQCAGACAAVGADLSRQVPVEAGLFGTVWPVCGLCAAEHRMCRRDALIAGWGGVEYRAEAPPHSRIAGCLHGDSSCGKVAFTMKHPPPENHGKDYLRRRGGR